MTNEPIKGFNQLIFLIFMLIYLLLLSKSGTLIIGKIKEFKYVSLQRLNTIPLRVEYEIAINVQKNKPPNKGFSLFIC